MAMIASSRCQPVSTAAPTPTTTPAEVQTSRHEVLGVGLERDGLVPAAGPEQHPGHHRD